MYNFYLLEWYLKPARLLGSNHAAHTSSNVLPIIVLFPVVYHLFILVNLDSIQWRPMMSCLNNNIICMHVSTQKALSYLNKSTCVETRWDGKYYFT